MAHGAPVFQGFASSCEKEYFDGLMRREHGAGGYMSASLMYLGFPLVLLLVLLLLLLVVVFFIVVGGVSGAVRGAAGVPERVRGGRDGAARRPLQRQLRPRPTCPPAAASQ